MVQKGVNRLKLEKYLESADPGSIKPAIDGLRLYVTKLRESAERLNNAASIVSGQGGGDGHLSGATFQSAGGAFDRSSEDMVTNSDTVLPAVPAVTESVDAITKARTLLTGMPDVDDTPPAPDPTLEGEALIQAQAQRQTTINQQQAALAEQEAQAAEEIKKIDKQYEVAVEEMKKIHGIPDPETPTDNFGSPQGPGGGDNLFVGPRSNITFTDPDGNDNDKGDGDKDKDKDKDKGTIGTTRPIEVGPEHPGHPGVIGTRPGGETGVTMPPESSPFPGVSTTGSGSSDISGGSGGLSGAATAGIIGGVGLGLGGLGAVLGKSLAGKGGSTPGLAGKAGAIGATSRSAGSAVTGKAGAGTGGAGGRGAGGAGAGGRGAGGRGAGAGAGRAGAGAGRGGAGGRGAGGRGAGAGGGRGSKKDRRKGDVWEQVEDREQWLDDDGAGESVIN